MVKPLRASISIAFVLAFGCGDSKTPTKPAPAERNPGKPLPTDAKAATPTDPGAPEAKPSTGPAAWTWTVPAGLGAPPGVPADNPMTQAKVDLGHQLFMDKRLSVTGTHSCYSCHQNHLGNADGRKTALGPGSKPLPRNTPTIWNVAYHPALYWEGRAATLEAQAIGALKGGNMGLGDQLEAKAAEIGALPEYAPAFASVFELPAGSKVTADHIAKALSAYERTLLCGDTPYDKQQGMSEAAVRGQALFMGKASCITCHNGPNFSDGLFHVTGVAVDPKNAEGDVGRFTVTKAEEDKYKFRTPTLRNVSATAPYFHDGSVADLTEAVRIMAAGGRPIDGIKVDPLLLDRQLTDAEVADVVAFLEALRCPGALEEIGDQTVEGVEPPSDAG